MAKQRTDKSPYESTYGGGWISGAQKLAEMACERKAASQDATLSPYFWQSSPWKTQFLQQINHANLLLKTFDIKAIIAALRRPEAKRVYSLGAPFLKPLIEQEQHRLTLRQEAIDNAPAPERGNTSEAPRPVAKTGKSLREKLQDL